MPREIADPSGADGDNAYAHAGATDRLTLDRVFQHPLSHGLEWRAVVGLLGRIGDIEERHDGEFVLQAHGETFIMRRPHSKDLQTEDVVLLRHFLERAGWAPDAPGSQTTSLSGSSRGIIIVIDHAGARIFKVSGPNASAGVEANPGRHLSHHIEHTAHDRDRDETFPSDSAFFDQVAAAAGAEGDIVLIGQGKGQSDEAHHLSTYLLAHDKGVHDRIVAALTADPKPLTVPEMIEMGEAALVAHQDGTATGAPEYA